mmetsp:Transcript_8149/g.14754  ORF Transcript_8149/g.14754 Transcript_8149/m.14754 type:complete len:209 (+) Transcript_8149:867-1493(+)
MLACGFCCGLCGGSVLFGFGVLIEALAVAGSGACVFGDGKVSGRGRFQRRWIWWRPFLGGGCIFCLFATAAFWGVVAVGRSCTCGFEIVVALVDSVGVHLRRQHVWPGRILMDLLEVVLVAMRFCIFWHGGFGRGVSHGTGACGFVGGSMFCEAHLGAWCGGRLGRGSLVLVALVDLAEASFGDCGLFGGTIFLWGADCWRWILPTTF